MLKQINRVLRLWGLKLIRPRRYAPKSEAQRVKEFVEEFNGPKVPLSNYMGEVEWQNVPPYTPDELRAAKVPTNSLPPVNSEWRTTSNDNKTHYVGDGCSPPHEMPRVEQPTSDNKITGTSS